MSPKAGYTFSHWLLNGVATDYAQQFYYTMTDRSAELVAVYTYEYNPGNPAEPNPIDATYRLEFQADPIGSCTFSPSSGQRYKAGSQVNLRAYLQTGYQFLGWYDADDVLLSTSASFAYTMPEAHTTLTARTTYAPYNPNEPQTEQSDVDSEKNSVTVTAYNYVRMYGEENPAFEYRTTGEALTGEPDITCEATTASPVGVYPIVVRQGSIANDNCTFVNGCLTIYKAPLMISAGTYTKKQGEAMPEFALNYEGFKNGETESVLVKKPTVSCEATEASAPGEYPVTVGGAEAQNYAISYTNGKLIVTEADPVTIMAKSYIREYGDENPVFEYTADGASLNGTPEVICEATATSPVGTYDIIVRQGSVKNYNVTYVAGTLTITPAPLTVSVGNYSREQGEENPEFVLTYSGWKNGEDERVLTVKPVPTTTATTDSPVGEYDITVSGGEAQNYTFTYVSGLLTVTEPSGIDALLSTGRPLDVYTTTGLRLRHQVTTLDGLPKGIYIVGGRKVAVR